MYIRHHDICMNIFEQFEKQGIEFAFPTQTIFVNNQNEDTGRNID
jgi:small-conductance mechanosensitive channel